MLSVIIELAKLLGQPAILLVFCLLLLVWAAPKVVGLQRARSRNYRESVRETITIVTEIQSAAERTPELNLIKDELLHRLGIVDRKLASAERDIATAERSGVSETLNTFLSPESMVFVGAGSSIVALIANSLGHIFTSVSPVSLA